MKFLFASDSFKGSLSSVEIHGLLAQAAEEIFPGCETMGIPMADGGEGTMDAVVSAVGGQYRTVTVMDPLMQPSEARYGILPGGRALIEMAEASGLCLVPEAQRNPLHTTSFGTGQLIADALDQGIRDITIAIGGSATNDGGIGAMTALGTAFYDKEGRMLSGFGRELGAVSSIDISGMHPAVRETSFTVMCDVDNPLLGPDGAAYTFGAQKGATPEIQKELEQGMTSYAACLERTIGREIAGAKGAGAAGGMGAALMAFLNAELKSGIQTVLELVDMEDKLKGTDCVVTGEGRVDWQSVHGKVIDGVARCAKTYGIPVVVLAGGMGKDAQAVYDCGVDSIHVLCDGPRTLDYAMEHGRELYLDAARRMFRMLRVGWQMKK